MSRFFFPSSFPGGEKIFFGKKEITGKDLNHPDFWVSISVSVRDITRGPERLLLWCLSRQMDSGALHSQDCVWHLKVLCFHKELQQGCSDPTIPHIFLTNACNANPK